MVLDALLVPAAVLGGVGLFFGVLLAISSRMLHVEQDARLDPVAAALPGANCGGCGFPSCFRLALAILDGKAAVTACPVGGKKSAAAIAGIMGVPMGEIERLVAHVGCRGGINAQRRFVYDGLPDCLSASQLAGGPLECAYGCLGYGSCVAACPYNAMAIENSVAVVHAENCRACKKCVAACPRNLVSVVSEKQAVFVSCSSRDKGGELRRYCNIGCLGCTLCQKKCPADAIAVRDNLARIDYDKCVSCGLCATVCPRKLITDAAVNVVESIR